MVKHEKALGICSQIEGNRFAWMFNSVASASLANTQVYTQGDLWLLSSPPICLGLESHVVIHIAVVTYL